MIYNIFTLFIAGLFTDALDSSDYIVLNDMINEFELMWEEAVVT
jgi:hypothetical protein